MKIFFFLLVIFIAVSCNVNKNSFTADFDNTNDRVWVGKDFWSIPLEDWKVEDGDIALYRRCSKFKSECC